MSTVLQPGTKVESCVIEKPLAGSFNASTYVAVFSPEEAEKRLLREMGKIKDKAVLELYRKRCKAVWAGKKRDFPVFLKQYDDPPYREPHKKKGEDTEFIRKFALYQQKIHSLVNSAPFADVLCREYDSFICEEPGKRAYYQALEYFEVNQPLTELISGKPVAIPGQMNGKLTFDELLTHIKRLFLALSILHDDDEKRHIKIVHADLKPDNLLILPNPGCTCRTQLRLVDFDASLIVGEDHPRHTHFRENHPGETYRYRGTAGYVSPEHFEGDVPCCASDIFTASVIAFETLSEDGRPFPFGNAEYRNAVRKGQFHLSRMKGSLSKTAEAALKAGLSYDKSKRPSASEMLEALKN